MSKVPLGILKIKMRVFRSLHKVPAAPHQPYCQKRLYRLSLSLMLRHHCLSKEGKVVKGVCPYLTWLPLHVFGPVEPSLLKLMGWTIDKPSFAEEMIALGVRGEIPAEWWDS